METNSSDPKFRALAALSSSIASRATGLGVRLAQKKCISIYIYVQIHINEWMDGWMDYIDRLAILDILDIIWCIRYYMCTWLQFTKQRKSNSCPFGCQLLHESSHIWKDCSKTSDMIMNLGTIHQESPELFTNHKSDKHITHRYHNTSQMNHICSTYASYHQQKHPTSILTLCIAA